MMTSEKKEKEDDLALDLVLQNCLRQGEWLHLTIRFSNRIDRECFGWIYDERITTHYQTFYLKFHHRFRLFLID